MTFTSGPTSVLEIGIAGKPQVERRSSMSAPSSASTNRILLPALALAIAWGQLVHSLAPRHPSVESDVSCIQAALLGCHCKRAPQRPASKLRKLRSIGLQLRALSRQCPQLKASSGSSLPTASISLAKPQQLWCVTRKVPVERPRVLCCAIGLECWPTCQH